MITAVEMFVQCPACECMGHHLFALRTFRTVTIPDRDGEPIEITSWGDPPDGTPVIDRSCVFCHHDWTRTQETR